MSDLEFTTDLSDINWSALVERLELDNFHNGRTPEELAICFENSFAVAFAWSDGEIVGKARALSDSVCNAYVVDVWTYSPWRGRGVASQLMQLLETQLDGQHVYLFTDDAEPFYAKNNYKPQGVGMGKVIGRWLKRY